MGKDLRQFLHVVREAGPDFYVEAKRPLKPKYEVGVLQHKLAKEGRFPVVYCPEIEGSKLPLVANLFGSYEMLGLALDIAPERLKTLGKGGILQEYRRRQDKLESVKEVPASEAPVREIVLQGKDVDLGILPISHHAELNPERYITIGMTVCKDPDTGTPNVGIYRQEVKGKDRLACRMRSPHHGAVIAQRYAELRKPMEVVTFIGHHPAVAMALYSPSPARMNELELMGALLGEPIEVTPAVTVDLPVPALAEIAIEGVIDPTEMATEGPFSEAAGYYSEERPCYIMRVRAIAMRRDAIYHDLHPTHQEHMLVLLLGRESKIYDNVRSAVPTVKAVHIGPEEMCGKRLVYVSIKKRSEDEGRQAGLAALRATPLERVAVVVDDDVDVYDEREVLWAVATRIRADSVMSINPAGGNTGMDSGSGETKILLDVTKPVDKPFPIKVTPPKEIWESMSLKDYLK